LEGSIVVDPHNRRLVFTNHFVPPTRPPDDLGGQPKYQNLQLLTPGFSEKDSAPSTVYLVRSRKDSVGGCRKAIEEKLFSKKKGSGREEASEGERDE